MIAVSHSERERDGACWRTKLPLCVAFRVREVVGWSHVSSERWGWLEGVDVFDMARRACHIDILSVG